MKDIDINKFPCVERLKEEGKTKELSKFEERMARWNELRKTVAEHGTPLPQGFCATLAGVSRQRIDQLVMSGVLTRIKLGALSFVTEKSFEAWLESERAAGRHALPRSKDGTITRALKASRAGYLDMIEQRKHNIKVI